MTFMRKRLFARSLEKSRPVIKALQDIAKSYGCSASEVALSWLVNFYGNTVVAIPGATKTEQVKQNIGALNLKLTKSEMAKLDELSLLANSKTG
jgi:aryl-alcohol dehydrogenase-like predicted oxidoreductase